MKILCINHKLLKSIWSSSRKPGGSVPQAVRLFTSLNLSEFEVINRGDKEVPKYFNLTNDVLNKWSNIEKVVKAFVVLSPEFASHNPEKLTRELQDHVKKVTAPYKYPRKVEFVQELPKTISGKIRRNKLRKWEWGEI